MSVDWCLTIFFLFHESAANVFELFLHHFELLAVVLHVLFWVPRFTAVSFPRWQWLCHLKSPFFYSVSFLRLFGLGLAFLILNVRLTCRLQSLRPCAFSETDIIFSGFLRLGFLLHILVLCLIDAWLSLLAKADVLETSEYRWSWHDGVLRATALRKLIRWVYRCL